MSWISRKTGRYCQHPDEAWSLMLHDGQHWEGCDDCGKTVQIGRLSEIEAAVFQTAIDCGRSWNTAMDKARSYERRNITVPFKPSRSSAPVRESESADTRLRERPR